MHPIRSIAQDFIPRLAEFYRVGQKDPSEQKDFHGQGTATDKRIHRIGKPLILGRVVAHSSFCFKFLQNISLFSKPDH